MSSVYRKRQSWEKEWARRNDCNDGSQRMCICSLCLLWWCTTLCIEFCISFFFVRGQSSPLSPRLPFVVVFFFILVHCKLFPLHFCNPFAFVWQSSPFNLKTLCPSSILIIIFSLFNRSLFALFDIAAAVVVAATDEQKCVHFHSSLLWMLGICDSFPFEVLSVRDAEITWPNFFLLYCGSGCCLFVALWFPFFDQNRRKKRNRKRWNREFLPEEAHWNISNRLSLRLTVCRPVYSQCYRWLCFGRNTPNERILRLFCLFWAVAIYFHC